MAMEKTPVGELEIIAGTDYVAEGYRPVSCEFSPETRVMLITASDTDGKRWGFVIRQCQALGDSHVVERAVGLASKELAQRVMANALANYFETVRE